MTSRSARSPRRSSSCGPRGFDAAPSTRRSSASSTTTTRRAPRSAAQKRAMLELLPAGGARRPAISERAIDEVKPDAVLVDINAWGALGRGRGVGRSVGLLVPLSAPGALARRAAVRARASPPARGLAGTAPRRRASARRLRRARADREARGSTRCARRRPAAVQPARPTCSSAPPLLLYMTAEPFEYPRSDWPENVRLVGPCDWDPPAEPPAWLDEIERADRARHDLLGVPGRRPARPLRAGGAGRRAATRRRDAARRATRRASTPPRTPASSPSSPTRPILDRAACAITHGGMGATQKALARGVPVCVVPFGRDQLEVARRVEVAGAGTRLPAKRLSPKRLRAAVREATRRAPGARRIADSYRKAGGAGRGRRRPRGADPLGKPQASAGDCRRGELGVLRAT